MGKVKTCVASAQLEEHGVLLDSKWAFNPVGVYKPKRQKLKQFMLDLDGTQAVNRFEWKGLPKTIPSYLIEQMLYHRGTLVFFKEGNEFRILPYVSSGSLNVYGQMSEVKPLPYNGGALKDDGRTTYLSLDAIPVTIDYYGDSDASRRGVILYDRINGFAINNKITPKFWLQETIVEEIVNRLSFLNINLVNSQGKNIILVKDPKQGKAIEKALDNVYSSDKSYSLVKSMFEVQVINNEIKYDEQSLWEDAMSWNNLRLQGLGIDNNGLFNKKERQLTAESSANDEQTDVMSDAYYMARRQFVDMVKEVFKDDADFKAQFKDFDVVDLRQEQKKKQAQNKPVKVEDEQNDDNFIF